MPDIGGPFDGNRYGLWLEDAANRYPLLVDRHGQIESAIRDWMQLDFTRRSSQLDSDTRSGFAMHPTRHGCPLPRFNYGPQPALKLNQLYVPSGACRWSEMYVAVPRDDRLLCRAWGFGNDCQLLGGNMVGDSKVSTAHTAHVAYDPQPIGVRVRYHDDYQPIAFDMHVADIRFLQNGENITGEPWWPPEVMLLRLVDERFFWQYRAFGGMCYGRPPTLPPDALFPTRYLHASWSGTPGTWHWPTWDTLLSKLSVECGGGGFTHPLVDPMKWGHPDPLEWDRPFEPISVMIDAAAASLQRRLAADIFGRYALEEWTTTNFPRSRDNHQDNAFFYPRRGCGRTLRGPRCQRVLIAFQRNHQGHLCHKDRWWWCLVANNRDPSMWNITMDPPPVVDAACLEFSSANADGWGQHYTTDVVYSSCYAYFTDNTADCPDNILFLRDLARQIAVARLGWQAGSTMGQEYLIGPPMALSKSGLTDYLIYDFASEHAAPYTLRQLPDVVDDQGKVTEAGRVELQPQSEYRQGIVVKQFDEDFGARYNLSQDNTVPYVFDPIFILPEDQQSTAVFLPGDSKQVLLALVNPATKLWECPDAAAEITLHDPQFQLCAVSNGQEPIRAIWSDERDRWETACPQGLLRKGVSLGTITSGGSGSVMIYDNDLSTGVSVMAHLVWMEAGGQISDNKEVTIYYDSGERRWWIPASQC